MAVPTLSVRIAFATAPFAVTPTWVDVTNDVMRADVNMGRNWELDRFQPGTARVVLEDKTRVYDPTNTSSTYSPNILPRKKISIRATYSAVTYDLFTGYIDAWPPAYDAYRTVFIAISATDGFKMLQRATLNTTFAQQGSGARVAAVLDAVGWPAADRAIDAGYSTCQAVTLDGVSALDHLQAVQDAEGGELFIAGNGNLTFRGRYARYTGTFATATATWGDLASAGELGYQQLTPSFDDTRLYTTAEITSLGGTKQTVTDATAVTNYGQMVYQKTGLLNASDNDALAIANYVVATYKAPRLRFDVMKIAQKEANYARMMGGAIGQRHTIKRRPPGGGTAISQDSHIESISHQYTVASRVWDTRWSLSPADTATYFIIDTSSVDGAALIAW